MSASVWSQTTKMNVKFKNSTLQELFLEIEKSSNYRFFYNNDEVDVNQLISVDTEGKTVGKILEFAFKDLPYSFKELDNNLILIERNGAIPNPIGTTMQQQKNISGKVTDSSGFPLPGVSIVIKGTTKGIVSDSNGNYSLSNIPKNCILQFSFIGMKKQDIDIGNQTTINVILKEDSIDLDEVVAIGYGYRLKEELSGSVSTITSEKINISNESSVMSRLQGQVSGVTITNDNTPGGSANVCIRGLGTINDSSPLYVIDGVPVGPSNSLNSNDIESISILKDASSAAIYGSRGANGVVIITTKNGRKNEPTRISFAVRTGINQSVKGYDLLNTEQYGEVLWMTARNQGYIPGVNFSNPYYGSGTKPIIPDYILPNGAMEGDPGTSIDNYSYDPFDKDVYGGIVRANKEGTNWFDEITRKGVVQEYNLSAEGGGKNIIYASSANYLKENGILNQTGFERFSFRNNMEITPFTDWLKVGQSLQVSLTKLKGDLDNNGEYSPIANSFKLQPIIPVYDIKGNYAGTIGKNLGESNNPVAQLERSKDNKNDQFRILGNLFIEAKILEGLTFKSLFGYNYNQYTILTKTIPAPEHFQKFIAAVYKESNTSFQWNWSNTINYNATFSDIHKLNVIFGTESVENNYDWMNGSRDDYFSLDPNYMQLSSGEGEQKNSGSKSEWSLFSIFGRVNYNLMGKYIFEATARRDGSSRFGVNNRFSIFPAGSFAWLISEEKFLKDTKKWLDFFKLRFGVGMSGNDRIGNYNSYSTFGSDDTFASYDIQGTNTSVVSGFMPLTLGNPNVGWEKTQTFNIGMDMKVFNNTLDMSVDVWQRNTKDMLYQLSIPVVSGIATAPFVNIGEMKNTGFDFELGYHNTAISGKLKYSITATISSYANEVVKLSDEINEEIIMGDYRQINYLRSSKGRSFPEFYGYIVDGLFQTKEEVDNYPIAFGEDGNYNKIGHFKYRDLNYDGVIDDEDMTYIGNPHPDFTGGLNIDLRFANFDLNMFFYGSYGNDMINLARRNIDYGMYDGNYSEDVLYKSWGSPYLENNKNAKLPIHDLNDGSIQPSTAFIEDGSFLRLKNLMFGYNFSNNINRKLHIQNLRIYSQITNLFTITNYSGLDPELNTSVNRMGLDFGSWPTPRQFSVGITFGL
ncbi:MAG: TonB-dependent receptor [Dysgonamonadaceae bacterium]